MTKTWNPEIRARRIPGPSALAVVRVAVLSGLGGLVLLVITAAVFLFQAAIGGQDPDSAPVPFGPFAVALALGLLSRAGMAYMEHGPQAAELRAGYTTVFVTPDRVPHVDPRSNRVIRLAGEPALDRAEHRRRLGLARESARRDREVHRIGGTARTAAPTPEIEDWAAVIRDADGTPLADGDTVIVLKRLSGKGSSAVVPAGTRLRNIRLRHEADDDRLVGAVARGAGPVRLRPSAVRKV
ncbi:alkylphosphonate utilization protein [Promicromonospora sp. NPDC057488]|uniref:alkylphosphonate utilization protein n=1 Tax=Promicromonospora sp. NPDC057488 TaxID=3346147 RepID=UPI00366ACDF1